MIIQQSIFFINIHNLSKLFTQFEQDWVNLDMIFFQVHC